MGLFTKKSPAEKLAQKQQKALEEARRAGVETMDALAVAHSINMDRAYVTLVVRPERVEVHNHGKVGDPLHTGRGVHVVRAEELQSVSWRFDAGRAIVEVEYAGGQSLGYHTSHEEAPVLAEKIGSLIG